MARILKPIGQYSAKKARRYLVAGLAFLAPFAFLFVTAFVAPFHLKLDEWATTYRGFYMGAFFTLGALLIMYPYSHWRSGLKGEKLVCKNLAEKLGAEYSIFNNVLLKGGRRGGDIDHIVVGPTGIFVLETKNNQSSVYYNGYQWKNISRSPSDQVETNMFRIKDTLLQCEVFKKREPYIYGIVVFSNGKLKLKIDRRPKWSEILQIKNSKDDVLTQFVLSKPTTFSVEEILSIEQFLKTRINNLEEESIN
jgi:hypothetical protein